MKIDPMAPYGDLIVTFDGGRAVTYPGVNHADFEALHEAVAEAAQGERPMIIPVQTRKRMPGRSNAADRWIDDVIQRFAPGKIAAVSYRPGKAR